MMKSLLSFVLASSLWSQVYSFALSNIPSNIVVKKQFSVDWASQEGDPLNVNILVFDAIRTPACRSSEGSHYELSQVVSSSSGQGSVPFTVPHSGNYILCAFNFTNSSDPSRSITGTSFFNSSNVVATLPTQTVTVTAGSSQQTGGVDSASPSSSKNNDGAIIGGTVGGFLALLLAVLLSLFCFGRYRIVHEDDPRFYNSKYSDHVEGDTRSITNEYERVTGTANIDSGSLYPPTTTYRSGISEHGWGSQSGPSELAEETPPSYASVSGHGVGA
ncbi:hypothetical protein PM082_009531 [Marasmius tenuissimus]|nr:hypothetical protein PM082_009531 [Marasmius tenuissimus]